MKVILRKRVPQLGEAGDIVEVADGYARNYLIPKQMSYQATQGNINKAQSEAKARIQEVQRLREEEKDLAERLQGVSVTVAAQAAEEGKLFGSVSAQSIAEALVAQGFSVDKRQIEIEAPLKELGVFPVAVRFSQDLTAEIRVWVVKE